MTRKRFQKLLMSEGVPARLAKDYKIPSKHNGIIGYCYGENKKGKTEWVVFNGTSYQSWWDNKIIWNNKLFNINSIGGRGCVKKPFGQSWYKVPDEADELGLTYKSPFLNYS